MHMSGSDPHQRRDAACDQQMALATIFAACLALGSLVVAIVLRQRFGIAEFNPALTGYLRSGALVMALLVLPYLAPGRRHGLHGFAVLVLILVGLVLLRGSTMLVIDLACLSVLVLAWRPFWQDVRALPRSWVTVMAATGVGVGALLILVIPREFILLGPELAMLGLLHPDTLFHVAISKLLEGHGIVTLGMDGLVATQYHVMSHRVIAGFSSWTGIDLLLGYGIFQNVISIPVMLGLLLQAAAQFFHAGRNGALTPPAAILSVQGWLAIGGVVMWHSYFESESYTLSLWFLIYAVVLLYQIALAGSSNRAITLHVALALCVALAALAKVSVGAVLACAVAAGVAAQAGLRPTGLIKAILVGLLPALAVYVTGPVAAGGDEPFFKLFDFFRYAEPALYALLFAAILSFLAYRHWPADKPRQVMIIALLTGAYAGLCASYLLNLPAGAHYYFSDPGSWMGLMIIPLLGLAPKWLLRRPAPVQVVWCAVLLAGLLALHDRKLRGIEKVQSVKAAAADWAPDMQTGQAVLSHARLAQIWSEFSTRPAAFDAVHVSAEYLAFWNGHSRCWASSFVFPALLGHPMVAGLPPEAAGCEITPYYGFSDYDLAVSGAAPNMTAESLCARARLLRFSSVLWIMPDRVDLLECAAPTETE